MTDFTKVQQALERRGYTVRTFAAAEEAAAYLDGFRARACGANLIQAQRDCFGAHTYERTDRPGSFHYDWRKTP